jgi:hypothetical protein
VQLMNGNGQNGNSLGNTILDELGKQAAQVGTTALGLPRRIEDTIDKLERGDLRFRVRSSETDRLLRRLSAMQMVTNYTIALSAMLVSATILAVNSYTNIAIVVAIAALIPLLALVRLLRRIERQDRMF